MPGLCGWGRAFFRGVYSIEFPFFRPKLCLVLLLLPSIGLAQVDHLQRAEQLLSQGESKQAESEARLVLSNPVTRPVSLPILGAIPLQEGKFQQGEEFLTQALALNPHLVGARITLGEAYSLQGKFGAAKKSFQDALARDPSNFNARFDLAKAESSLGNFQESLKIAEPILSQMQTGDDGILLLTTDYGALGNTQELGALYEKWQQLPAPSADVAVDFGTLLTTYGMKAEAKKIFDKAETAITTDPSQTPAQALKLGKGYFALGIMDHAEKAFNLALTLDPECTLCDVYLAQITEQQGLNEQALAYLIEAKKRAPKDPDVLFEFGKVCLQQNLVKDALAALDEAVRLRPDRDSYVYVLASANVASGDLTKAAALLSGLLQKHPKDPALSYAMGAVYYLQAKYPEAESSLKRSLELEPDQVAAAYYLALTYDASGEDEKAVPIFRDLLKNHPQHALANVKLGGILVREHQYEEAQQDLERAVSLDPNSAEAHYQLGVLLGRLGKKSESEAQFALSRKFEAEQRSRLRLQLLTP